MNQQTSELVIRKSVTVEAPLEHAFRIFTEEIHTWWPLRTHAVDTDQSDMVILEGCEGGRLFERTPGGDEHLWGTVAVWDPPHRVGYSWHPGRGADTAQEVEVTFTSEGEGTRVDIRHWGWERLGEPVDETVASYEEGWDVVLAHYVGAANA
jgi:uncharacterized protein YndB with AHSA1/START domain